VQVAPVLPQILTILTQLPTIFSELATIGHMLRPLGMVLLEALVRLGMVLLKLLQPLLAPLGALLHDLGVLLRIGRLQILEALLDVGLALRHQLLELLRILLLEHLEPFLAMLAGALLHPLLHLLELLRIGRLQLLEPLAHLRLALLDRLLERFGVLLLQLSQPVELFRVGAASLIGAILEPIADIFPAIVHILAPVADVLAMIPDVLELVAPSSLMRRIPTVFHAVSDILPPITHVLALVLDVLSLIPHILASILDGTAWALLTLPALRTSRVLRRLGIGNRRLHQPYHDHSQHPSSHHHALLFHLVRRQSGEKVYPVPRKPSPVPTSWNGVKPWYGVYMATRRRASAAPATSSINATSPIT